MKKRLTAVVIAVLVLVSVLVCIAVKHADKDKEAEVTAQNTTAFVTDTVTTNEAVEEASSESEAFELQSTTVGEAEEATLEAETYPELTTVAPQGAQVGITVDSWLKISAITEYEGRLAVLAENVSDCDVEYALLTVKTIGSALSFNVSALLQGEHALLICNENVSADPNESYTLWQTENRVDFAAPPRMNADKIEVSIKNGSISVKNISPQDISSDIYIYYKDKINNTVNGSVTHRIRVSPLKAGANVFLNARGLNESNCRIIFSDF